MVFSTLTFLFVFLPVTFIGYYVMPKKARNLFLLVMSLVFYVWSGIGFLRILIASIILNYFAGLLIGKTRAKPYGKAVLAAGIIADLLILGYFKYTGFFAEIISNMTDLSIPIPEIVLPIGISFYMFQSMSYLIEVYRGEKALKSPIDLGMYIALFPQLIAGPIVRYNQIKPYIHDRKTDKDEIIEGFELFLRGLCKKVLLANQLAAVFPEYYQLTNEPSSSIVIVWLQAVCFLLQLYYDFSGYSDMAIGLGHMFGFTFPENFRHPFCAATITDFWRRWHISLYSWFRDYVYIPLGGSRAGELRTLVNIFIVWTLSGMWHGAAGHYVIWGILLGAMFTVEKYIVRPERFKSTAVKTIYRIIVLIMVVIVFVFFRVISVHDALDNLYIMFGLSGLPVSSVFTVFLIKNSIFLLAAAIIFTMPVTDIIRNSSKKSLQLVYAAGLIICTVLSIAFVMSGSYNPFLYFQF